MASSQSDNSVRLTVDQSTTAKKQFSTELQALVNSVSTSKPPKVKNIRIDQRAALSLFQKDIQALADAAGSKNTLLVSSIKIGRLDASSAIEQLNAELKGAFQSAGQITLGGGMASALSQATQQIVATTNAMLQANRALEKSGSGKSEKSKLDPKWETAIADVSGKFKITDTEATDTVALIKYNQELKNGTAQQEAYKRTMTGASESAAKMAEGMNGAAMPMGQLTGKLVAQKVATIGLSLAQGLLTGALSMLASIAITGIVTAIDQMINKEKYAAEKAAELLDNYNTLSSEAQSLADNIISVNQELATTQERINELNSLKNPTLADKEELDMLQAKNRELAEQYRLLEIEQQFKQKDVTDAAVGTYSGSKMESLYTKEVEAPTNYVGGSYIYPAPADQYGYAYGTYPPAQTKSTITITPDVTYDVALEERLKKLEELQANKAELDAKLISGEITQEDYDKQYETLKAQIETYQEEAFNLRQTLDAIIKDLPDGSEAKLSSERAVIDYDLANNVRSKSDVFFDTLDKEQFMEQKEQLTALVEEGKRITPETLGGAAFEDLRDTLDACGISLEDASAALNSLGKPAETATTQVRTLREMLMDLSDTGKERLAALKSSVTTALDWRTPAAEANAALTKINNMLGLELTQGADGTAETLQMVSSYIDGDINSFQNYAVAAANAMGLSINPSNMLASFEDIIAAANRGETSALAFALALKGIGAFKLKTVVRKDEHNMPVGTETILAIDPVFEDALNALQAKIAPATNRASTGPSVDKVKEAFEKQYAVLQREKEKLEAGMSWDTGIIADLSDFYNQLEALNNQYYKNRPEDYQQHEVAIFQGRVALLNDEISDTEHRLDLMTKNGTSSTAASIETYRGLQDKVHAMAEGYRARGYDDDSEFIQALVDQWWGFQEKINEITNETYSKTKGQKDQSLFLLEQSYGGSEGKMDQTGMSKNLEEQKRIQQEIMNNAAAEAERIRKLPGDNSAALNELSRTWWEAFHQIENINQTLVDNSLSQFDDFISNADSFNWWDNLGTTKAEVLEQKLAEINRLYAAGLIPSAKEYQALVNDTAKLIYEEKNAALQKTIDLTMEMIKQEKENEIAALEKQKTDYADIVALKKEALQLSKEENDYQKSLSEKLKDISSLQARIDELAPDTSREAIAQRKALEEELAQKQGDLGDYQADHSYQAQLDALDKSQSAFEDEKDKEIETVKSTIDTTEKLYQLAIGRINADWDALYADLKAWNLTYGDGISGEDSITSAWKTAKDAAKDYQGVLEAISGIETEHAPISPAEMQAKSKVAQMKSNSKQWHSGLSQTEKDNLAGKNDALAQEIAALLDATVDRDLNSGVWYITGADGVKRKLFDLYHTGGVVGQRPTLKQNESMAILEKGEVVLDSPKQEGLYKIIDFASVLSQRLGVPLSSLDTGAFMGIRPNFPGMGALKAIQSSTNSAYTFSPNITVQVTPGGDVSDSAARRFGNVIADTALVKFRESFSRNGQGGRASELFSPA